MRQKSALIAVALACLAIAAAPVQEAVRTVATFTGEVYAPPALSPDGRYLVVATNPGGGDFLNGSLLVTEVASGRSSTVLTGYFEYVDWSPRGDMLAFNRGDPEARTDFIWTLPIDPGTGRAAGEARRVSVSAGDVVAFSPDGQSIAFADYNAGGQRVVIVPTRGGRERVMAETKGGIGSIAWSEDGAWIYYSHGTRGTAKGTVARVSAAGGVPQVVWETPIGRAQVIEPGPMIVQPEGGRRIRILDEAGRRAIGFAESEGDDRIRILDRTTLSPLVQFPPPAEGDFDLGAASADGRRLYGLQENQEGFRLLEITLPGAGARGRSGG